MQLTGQQKYSFGTVNLELALEGGYSGLPPEALDKMLAAAQIDIAQLPAWIEGRNGDSHPRYVGRNEQFSAEETDDDGSIHCTLQFQGVTPNAVPHRIASGIPKAIIRSCITAALVHTIGVQAMSDPYVRANGFQLTPQVFEETTDAARSSRTKQHG
jgi:outer membrane biogenesis lipoprotein LolB